MSDEVRKKKWWAELSAALGPDERYSEKAFAMIDSKKIRMTVFANALTSSLRTPKIFIKEFSYFLMPCHQHCLGVNLLVQR